MAELIGINAPILPTQRIENVDFTPMMMQVGNELNKRYWENRKMYLEGVVQPLAKVEADEFGQKELNRIKGEIEARSREFEESGNWHKAGDFVFNEIQNIVTNPTLKEIIKSKANYDAFVKSVNESNWSTSDKNGFMLRAHHASSEITTDENGMVTGGFSPISIGESYDLSKYSLDVLDKISKIKADKVNVSQVINDPKALEAYGLPSIVDNEGRTLVSHIVEQTVETENVTADDLANVAQQIVALNPEVQKQIFETETNSFYTRYYDKASRTFKDVPNDIINESLGYKFYNTYQGYNNVQQYIEDYLDLDPSTFLIEDATGAYQYNRSKIKDFDKKNKQCINKFGITIDSLYTEGVDDRLQDRIAQIYSDDLLKSLNLTRDNKELINELIISKNVESAWKDYIENITGTSISLYAYNHITKSNNFIENPAYAAYLKNYYKYSLKPGDGYDSNLPSSVDENGLVDYTNFLSSNLENINKLSEDKNKIIVNDNQIITDLTSVKNPKLEELGFIKDGKIDKSALQQVDLAKLDEDAKKGNYYNTDNYQAIRNAIIQLRANKEKIDDITRLQESYKFNAKTLYDDYNKEANKAKKENNNNYYHGIGRYGIASDIAKFIANNNITSVEEFREAVDNSKTNLSYTPGTPYGTQSSYLLEDPKGNTYVNNSGYGYLKDLSDEEIQKEISNVLDNIQHRYEKKTGEPFQWAQQSFSITNPNYTLQVDLEGRKAAWRGNSGSLQTIALADGSAGNEVLTSDIASLIGLNQFPVSIKTNEKGDTITEKNIITDKSTPIKKDVFKTKDDVYKTEIRYSLNPTEQAQGYIAYDIICYDKSNAYCGTVKVREKSDNVGEYLLNVYEQFKPLADAKNSQGRKAIGVVMSNIGETSYKFESKDSQPAEGLTELKNNVENMYQLGKNGYTYKLKINQVYANAEIIDPIDIKITKVMSGYIIEDLSKEKGVISIPEKYQKILGLKGVDTGWNGQKVFPTLDLAFVAISDFNLRLSSILRTLDKQTK